MAEHGHFVWNEFLTRDVETAKAFYAGTLGWRFHAKPIPDGVYWIATRDGVPVAGLMAMPPNIPARLPAHRFCYIEVDDVDARAAEMVKAGGELVRPPFDIPDVGRIAIMHDAAGAGFGLMKSVTR